MRNAGLSIIWIEQCKAYGMLVGSWIANYGFEENVRKFLS